METIRYTKDNIKEIKELLLNGNIVAFPTDTVFGLACVYDDEKAIQKVMEAKNRPLNKPLPMMCANKEMIKEVAYVDENSRRVINKFMPGALTIVFKKKENVPDFVTLKQETIAIRIPDDEWIINLIKEVNKPLLVTSANYSDKGSLLKADDVYNDLKGRIDAIVMEDARGDKASTIIGVFNELSLLREGPIEFELLKKEYEG